jgi:protein-tyrosine phosphatase
MDRIVSLLEPDEEAQLELEGESGAAAASGIDYVSFPIPDRGIPTSNDDVVALGRQMVVALEAGRSVAVHCRQSIGRSGLIAASVLLLADCNLDAALAAISKARGLQVPETEGQRRWLSEFDRSE